MAFCVTYFIIYTTGTHCTLIEHLHCFNLTFNFGYYTFETSVVQWYNLNQMFSKNCFFIIGSILK